MNVGGAQACQAAAGGERQVVRQAIEQSGRIEIARTGGVDQPLDRRRLDHVGLVAGDDH